MLAVQANKVAAANTGAFFRFGEGRCCAWNEWRPPHPISSKP